MQGQHGVCVLTGHTVRISYAFLLSTKLAETILHFILLTQQHWQKLKGLDSMLYLFNN